MDVLSPFISVLCHSDFFTNKSIARLDELKISALSCFNLQLHFIDPVQETTMEVNFELL